MAQKQVTGLNSPTGGDKYATFVTFSNATDDGLFGGGFTVTGGNGKFTGGTGLCIYGDLPLKHGDNDESDMRFAVGNARFEHTFATPAVETAAYGYHLTSGTGGAASGAAAGGSGGSVEMVGGTGGAGDATFAAGAGGSITFTAGSAGTAAAGGGANGGSVTIDAGAATGSGTNGSIDLAGTNATAVTTGADVNWTADDLKASFNSKGVIVVVSGQNLFKVGTEDEISLAAAYGTGGSTTNGFTTGNVAIGSGNSQGGTTAGSGTLSAKSGNTLGSTGSGAVQIGSGDAPNGPAGTLTYITGNANTAADHIWQANASEVMRIDVSANETRVPDNQYYASGGASDLRWGHDSSNSSIANITGNLTITNSGGDIDIDNTNATGTTYITLGTDDVNTAFSVRNNSGTVLYTITGASASATYSVNLNAEAGLDVSGADLTIAAGLGIAGLGALDFSDGNKAGSGYSTDFVLSDSSAEWDAFETAFGEVSLLNAIEQAATGGEASFVRFAGTADEALIQYELVCADDTNASGDIAGADHNTTGGPFNRAIGVAAAAASAAAAVEVYVMGEITVPAAQWDGASQPAATSIGSAVYGSVTTAGEYTVTAPTASGDTVQVVGTYLGSGRVLLNLGEPVEIA